MVQELARMRRLRLSEPLRAMFQETHLQINDLIYPIFVEEDVDDYTPIAAMPGINRIPERKLAYEIEEIAKWGISAVMLFGISHHKDQVGTNSWQNDGLLARMVRIAKEAAPALVVIPDICFCEYTTHGHCGVIWKGQVDNDLTIANLAKQAVTAARAGADLVAPSAMMDGQVAAIRKALNADGLSHVPIMSYSSKFASSLYGPFRIAAGCHLVGDRKTYQMNPMNAREALRESLIDEQEGADILMVKPALSNLDIVSKIRAASNLPLAAYQVSGEYAMIKAAAAAGWIDEERVVRETLGAIRRAGADVILTYFALELARQGI